MRWYLQVTLLIAALSTTAIAAAQEFPLQPVSVTASRSGPSRVTQFNDSLRELKTAYEQYLAEKGKFSDVLAAGMLIDESLRGIYLDAPARSEFAQRHFEFAKSLEELVNKRQEQGKATDHEVRQAKFLRLTTEMSAATGVPSTGGSSSPTPRMPTPPTNGSSSVATSPGTKGTSTNPGAPGKITARLLDIRTNPGYFHFEKCLWSESGRYGVVIETTNREIFKLALWDFEAGKLLRYLSASEGEGTKPYGGMDEADHGAETNFSGMRISRIIFSRDEKLIVALVQLVGPTQPPGAHNEQQLVWDLSSGKLTRTLSTGNHHPHTFFFVDNVTVATKTFNKPGVSLDLINVKTGQIDHLMPSANFEMYGGSIRNGVIPISLPGGSMIGIHVATRKRFDFNPPPPGGSNYAASSTWITKDEKFLLAHKHNLIEVWDTKTGNKVRDNIIETDDDKSIRVLFHAEDTPLIARERGFAKVLEFVDGVTGKVHLTIPWVDNYRQLVGVSADAKRIGLAADAGRLLLLDFEKGMPATTLDLAPLLQEASGKISR
ncbi:hypothetical protein ETAA8_69060 [Anatilimnocola aggregata]|uniref:Uncharacterized protein n=1 Tax=Anatilimnocola aggregata TaxID=2528021 RepID=A0A517YND9_9BACT|nr:hypothetical protein [Anatilimnocola aggregata]QDU31746.1 hypothetical protein ETAA8_69060 [Anatilimnocola aggregata]